MSFPQYHAPQVPFDGTWLWVPILFFVVMVLIAVFYGPQSDRSLGDGYLAPLFFMLALMGVVFSAGFLVAGVNMDKQADAEAQATKSYHSDIASYIDDTYGVKVTPTSAAELIDGKETAGVDPAGETITLSLLNRTQKEPVLIGTDHNPIPKFERLTADSDQY